MNIPDEVLYATEERGHSQKQIDRMTPKELFHEYCEWEGLLGYSEELWRIVTKLKAYGASKKNCLHDLETYA